MIELHMRIPESDWLSCPTFTDTSSASSGHSRHLLLSFATAVSFTCSVRYASSRFYSALADPRN